MSELLVGICCPNFFRKLFGLFQLTSRLEVTHCKWEKFHGCYLLLFACEQHCSIAIDCQCSSAFRSSHLRRPATVITAPINIVDQHCRSTLSANTVESAPALSVSKAKHFSFSFRLWIVYEIYEIRDMHSSLDSFGGFVFEVSGRLSDSDSN